jgi:hypothetical protein
MAMGLTQPLREVPGIFLGGKTRPVPKAEDLAAICEPVIWIMWDPQHLTTL